VGAAIVLWNTVYLEQAVAAIRQSDQAVSGEILAHLSRLKWEHINLTGDCGRATLLVLTEEKIVGLIRDAGLHSNMLFVAAATWRFAALRIQALNVKDIAHRAAAFVTNCVQQQPGDRLRLGRRHISRRFTDHAAAVLRLPSGSREVAADNFSATSKQLRIRRFQRPLKPCVSGFAHIDLVAHAVRL
jgi:hypothetical protein